LLHTTIPRKIIPFAAATTVPAKILAAAEIVAMIAAGIGAVIAAAADVGDAGADVHAADAHRVVRVAQEADAIFLHRNMLLRKAASLAAMIIAGDNLAVTTTGVRRLRALRRLQRPVSLRKRSFFPASRSQNIAASPPFRLRPFPVLSMKLTKSRALSKKFHRARRAISLPPLQAAAAFLAASLAVCLAGC
jgi:hypothetical protein